MQNTSRTGAMRLFIGILIVVAFWLGAEGRSEIVPESPPIGEKVNMCTLQADPAPYNHKMIEVRGVVSHGFENFTLSDPRCERGSGIWLEYGGRVSSETIYCCGVKSATPRDTALVVEGIASSVDRRRSVSPLRRASSNSWRRKLPRPPDWSLLCRPQAAHTEG